MLSGTHVEQAFETVLTDALLANGYEAIARAAFDRERAKFARFMNEPEFQEAIAEGLARRSTSGCPRP
jgi:hypothetical protein